MPINQRTIDRIALPTSLFGNNNVLSETWFRRRYDVHVLGCAVRQASLGYLDARAMWGPS